jgi:hypothetical protein
MGSEEAQPGFSYSRPLRHFRNPSEMVLKDEETSLCAGGCFIFFFYLSQLSKKIGSEPSSRHSWLGVQPLLCQLCCLSVGQWALYRSQKRAGPLCGLYCQLPPGLLSLPNLFVLLLSQNKDCGAAANDVVSKLKRGHHSDGGGCQGTRRMKTLYERTGKGH